MKEQTGKKEYSDQDLYEMSDILTTFAMMENAGTTKVDYGTGEIYTPAEVHTISFIADNPGCSNTQISKRFNKTLGATSQVLTRLKKKDLILTKKNKDNHKTLEIFLTEKGEELDRVHRIYDAGAWKNMLKFMREKFADQDIDTAFELVKYLLDFNTWKEQNSID